MTRSGVSLRVAVSRSTGRDRNGNPTLYGYDTENHLAAITDALGRVTSFGYDSLGRVTGVTFPSSLSESYTYDAMGNLLAKTDRKGQTIAYTYDNLDRLTRKQYPDSTGVDYVYDALSRLTQASDATGTYAFGYDNLGRLLQTTTNYSFLSRTLTMSYGYDAASNRVSMADPEGGVTSYAYDNLNRLTGLTDFNSGPFTFGYDQLGRRTGLSFPNGATASYQYDALSRLLSVLHQRNNFSGGATYAYDPVGNRTERNLFLQNPGTMTFQEVANYSYDEIYQLTQTVANGALSETYSYDAVGNRLSSLGVAPYTYNDSNELTSTPLAGFSYDQNGNTTSKTDGSGTTNYTWDFENRLVSVMLPGGVVSFTYDPFGRRIRKSSGSGVSVFVYDGDNQIEELNSAGSVVARYTQGLGIDEPLALYRGGKEYYYHADGLGSIVGLTDWHGKLAAGYVYDSFGNLTTSTGSVTNPFRYTAREFDSETGLYYYRARYYDPNAGRFLSEDPIGFESSNNFYVYVENNPAVFIDPSGLQSSVGGPWHPPMGVRFHCTCKDDCATLSEKIELFKKAIASHVEWELANKTGQHAKDLLDLANGLNNCIDLHHAKCTNKPPFLPVPVMAPQPQSETTKNVAKVATGAVVIYATYRIVRLIPSLFPPLWPTLPANAVIP